MKKKLFMLQKLWRDLALLASKKPVYELSTQLSSEQLEYPFIFDERAVSSGKKQRLISKFDENGIPLIKSYIDVEDNDLHYYPITIGQVGISVHNTYLKTASKDDEKRFLKFVTWFESNYAEDETGAYWLTSVPKPEYGVTEPWKSAFSQSRAISVLLRGYQITEDTSILKLIEKALIPFTVPYNKGGVAVFFDDTAIYEEYVASQPTMVLDGHIFSLIGPWEILKSTDLLAKPLRNKAKSIFDKGISGLEKMLPEYDLAFWFRFNLCKLENYPKIDPCTVGYMKLLQVQLKFLTQVSESQLIAEFEKKSNSYLNLNNAIKAYKLKLETLKALNRV